VRALADDDSGDHRGLRKGGLVAPARASRKREAEGRHSEYSKLRSVGRLFHERLVFTRGDLPIRTLRDLRQTHHPRRTRTAAHAASLGAPACERVTDNATYVDEDPGVRFRPPRFGLATPPFSSRGGTDRSEVLRVRTSSDGTSRPKPRHTPTASPRSARSFLRKGPWSSIP